MVLVVIGLACAEGESPPLGQGGTVGDGGSATMNTVTSSGAAGGGGSASSGGAGAGGSSTDGGGGAGDGGSVETTIGGAGGGQGGGTITFTTCNGFCDALAPIAESIACPVRDCMGDCVDLIAGNPDCADELLSWYQCGINGPIDGWTCVGISMLYTGPACEAELAAWGECAS